MEDGTGPPDVGAGRVRFGGLCRRHCKCTYNSLRTTAIGAPNVPPLSAAVTGHLFTPIRRPSHAHVNAVGARVVKSRRR